MFTISKRVEYSLALVKYLSNRQGKKVPLSEVTGVLNLPYRFASRLASELKLAGIVDSKEGKTGGYSLAKDWQDKTMYDLLKALGEDKRLVECLDESCSCPRERKCKIKGVWKKLEDSLVNDLKKIKLAEI